MTRTTLARHRRGLGILGVATLALVTLASGTLAQSASPAVPSVSDMASPAAAGAANAGRRIVVCPRIRARGGRRSDRDERRGHVRMRRHDTGRWSDGGPARQRRIIVPRELGSVRRVASISAIEGATLTLVTPDGWSRTVATTGILITRGGEVITVADLRVGDQARVAQRRADDGTWQVTRLRVMLTTARGTVASVTGDTFVLTTPDGAEVPIRTSDATTWVWGCHVDPAAPVEIGARVVVRGVAATDGSIDARVVAVGRARERSPLRIRDQGLPEPAASPAAASPGV